MCRVLFVAALAATGAAFAQTSSPPPAKVWTEAEPEGVVWLVPDIAAEASSGTVLEPGSLRGVERLADHAFKSLAERFPGWSLSPARTPDGEATLLLLSTNRRAQAGWCGAPPLASVNGDPALTVPLAWSGLAANSDDPLQAWAVGEAVGRLLAMAYCAEIDGFQVDDPADRDAIIRRLNAPLNNVMDTLGDALGFTAVTGAVSPSGKRIDRLDAFRLYPEVLSGRSSVLVESDLPGFATDYLGRFDLSVPVFRSDPDAADHGYDLFWLVEDRLSEGRSIDALLASEPDDPYSLASVHDWLDDAIKTGTKDLRSLGHRLAVHAYVGATAWLHARVDSVKAAKDAVYRRADWQGPMTGGKGCAPIVLSLETGVANAEVAIEPGASACLVATWDGAVFDPETPPAFTLIADAGVDDWLAMDGLWLAADQNFGATLTVETAGGETLQTESPTVGAIRPGLITEDARTGESVKAWELLFRPDEAFRDGAMTIILTNMRPDKPSLTKPMIVKIAAGPGAHEAEQALQARTFDADDADCRSPRRLAFPAPDATLQMRPIGATAFGDAMGDVPVEIGGRFVKGGEDIESCSRVLTLLTSDAMAGNSEAAADGPMAICSARLAKVQAAAMAAAASGDLATVRGVTPDFVFDITMGLKSPIRGAGDYPAAFDLFWSQRETDDGSLQPIQTATFDGVVTLDSVTRTSVSGRYSETVEDEPRACEGRQYGRISGRFAAPFALPDSDETYTILPDPRLSLTEAFWEALGEEGRAAVMEETGLARRGDGRSPAEAASGSAAVLQPEGPCTPTPELSAFIADMTTFGVEGEVKTALYDANLSALSDPAYPRELYCDLLETARQTARDNGLPIR